MTAKILMVQGTASSVGKSIITAALCRIMRQDGWNVAPFKAQNMSLNSFVTRDGGEMGRAQVVQAEAACVEPSVDMNPILLKPEADNRSQVIVRGKPFMVRSAQEYYALKDSLWSIICESLDRLLSEFELVLIEGAGSPAEINLRNRDMVNMAVALYCHAPVLLVADIDRGGAFASVVGTLDLLESQERAFVRAIVINKFRGDFSLLAPGLAWLEQKIQIPVAGVIPFFRNIKIAEEDSVPLERDTLPENKNTLLDIAVICLPHMSNFDDFDTLDQENGVQLRYIKNKDELKNPDLIILPGTKSTIADLIYIRKTGLADKVLKFARESRPVIGICGGYQMLGKLILDPQHIESLQSCVEGLGLLPVTTSYFPVKSTNQIKGHLVNNRGLLSRAGGVAINGYEIHMGQTTGEGDSTGLFMIEERSRRPCRDFDGCQNMGGNIIGTYIHGLFHNRDLRHAILTELAVRKGIILNLDSDVISKEEEYDNLANLVRNNLDMNLINHIMRAE